MSEDDAEDDALLALEDDMNEAEARLHARLASLEHVAEVARETKDWLRGLVAEAHLEGGSNANIVEIRSADTRIGRLTAALDEVEG